MPKTFAKRLQSVLPTSKKRLGWFKQKADQKRFPLWLAGRDRRPGRVVCADRLIQNIFRL